MATEIYIGGVLSEGRIVKDLPTGWLRFGRFIYEDGNLKIIGAVLYNEKHECICITDDATIYSFSSNCYCYWEAGEGFIDIATYRRA